jgi:fatty-acyl-CoA synthase
MIVEDNSEPVLSYVSGTSEVPLIGRTIGDYVDRAAAQYGTREALVDRQRAVRYTYAQLRQAVDECARGLMALGVAAGDRVGIWSPNRAEWTVVQLATAKVGAILVTINPAYRTTELAYVVRQSGLRLLVFAPRLKGGDYVAMLRELVPELDALSPCPAPLSAEAFPELRHLVLLDDTPQPGLWLWSDLATLADRVEPQALAERGQTLQFDDPINIQYTSGTTGSPKGATLSHHNILNNAFFVGERMGFTAEDRLCIPVPLYHCFGMVLGNLTCLCHGAAMIYPAETFDARATLEAVQEERCTALHGVPAMFIAELNHPEFDRFDLVSLRTGIMAGSPCPVEVMKQVRERMHMTEVEIGYGMTETSPISFQTRPDAPLEKRLGTVGQALPHVECKIIHPETGAIVPLGTAGEFCSRGYLVMLGYWNNPEATAAAIDAARWMHCGDLAVMDAQGYVNIVGRIKDMICRGGENIFPREIEEFLHTHPAVAEVQVIGVPCRRLGEEIMAWVRLRPGAAVDAEELRAYCRGRIAHFKIPRYVKLVESFPTTVTGKVQKYVKLVESFPTTVTGKVQKYVMRQQSVEELGLAEEILPTA